MSDAILYPLLAILTIMPVLDLASTIFFGRLFWLSGGRGQRDAAGDRTGPVGAERTFVTQLLGGRSWLLALLTVKFSIVTLSEAVIGLIAGARLLGNTVIDNAAIYVALSLIALGLMPPLFMVAFWRTRRKREQGPPPFSDRD